MALNPRERQRNLRESQRKGTTLSVNAGAARVYHHMDELNPCESQRKGTTLSFNAGAVRVLQCDRPQRTI